MVAHDELGGLLPIKRTIRVIDAQNQSFREQEVRRSGVGEGRKGSVVGLGFEGNTVGLGDASLTHAPSRSPCLRGGDEPGALPAENRSRSEVQAAILEGEEKKKKVFKKKQQLPSPCWRGFVVEEREQGAETQLGASPEPAPPSGEVIKKRLLLCALFPLTRFFRIREFVCCINKKKKSWVLVGVLRWVFGFFLEHCYFYHLLLCR